MPGILQESFIQSLPSKIYYRQNFESNNNYCFAFEDNSEFSKKKAQLNNYEKIKSVQDKLARALCYVAFTSDGNDCKEQCRNLYYWLGNELLLSKLEENSFSKVIGILNDISNILYKPGKCKCTFFKETNMETFEKMKTAFDYCKDHVYIKSTLENHNNMCNNEFSAYLVNADNTYNELYDCAKTKFVTYIMQLKNHIPSCFNEKLSRLTCIINKVSAEEQDSSPYNTANIDQEFVINPSTFGSSQIILYIVIPFIVIFFFGFLLYKFTPIWSWMNTRILKKKSSRRNLEDTDTLELTEYMYEQRKSNLDRRQLNVAYYAT
ncbi:PIR protein [Plasmodium malariae]|uniref:PIR protein n=1 Tax=Plasmodium malariae TaxID=5858 RepID=A0A1D3RH81_PLAMA|nr:PIR protein [Plasmodium malariae]SCN44533.1 PIR protein [Plasmodium malariae]